MCLESVGGGTFMDTGTACGSTWLFPSAMWVLVIGGCFFISWLPSSSPNRRLGILLEEVGVKDYGDSGQFQETKVRQMHR